MGPEVMCPSPSRAIGSNGHDRKLQIFGGVLISCSVWAFASIFPDFYRQSKYRCEPAQTYSVDLPVSLVIAKYRGRVLFDNQKSLWQHCTRQVSPISTKCPPLFGVYIRCWKDSSKLMRDAGHPGHMNSATQHLTDIVFFFHIWNEQVGRKCVSCTS